MIRDILSQEIQKAIRNILPNIKYRVAVAKTLNLEFGDYSANIEGSYDAAEKVAHELMKSERIRKYFMPIVVKEGDKGFLNFWLSEKGLIEGLANTSDSRYMLNFGKNKKMQVEFISANPTGELHIGHGRSVFYGDALSNILKIAGYDVQREFYVNDAKASAQIKELGKTALGKGTTYLTDYLKLKIKNLKLRISARGGSTFGGKGKDEGEAGYLLAGEIQKDNQRFIEKDLGVKFDKWFSEEKELYRKRAIEKALELLKSTKLVYEKDGALWLKTSKCGDNEDRVLIRSDKTPSYFLTDIAYHINKFKRGFKTVIDIWGADHQGHEKRMYAAKKALGWKGDLKILITQLVTLKEGGERKKISKRKGDIILLKDLLKEVGLDAMRWFFLEKALSTHMEFDLALAKEQSKKNPVYYVQYAGARMSSILAKSQIPKSKFQTNPKFQNPNNYERNLILKLIQFPEIIEDIAKDYQVHRLTTYVYELAKVFTDFYENVPVLKAETEELKNSRLALVFISRKILEKTLTLMGISAPERM